MKLGRRRSYSTRNILGWGATVRDVKPGEWEARYEGGQWTVLHHFDRGGFHILARVTSKWMADAIIAASRRDP